MSLYNSVLKRVLVATDLPDHADHAIERGVLLAAAHGAELDVVHVMEEGLPPDAQAEITATSEARVREKLAASPLSENVPVTIDLVIGLAETDIVERSVMTNADCIVLGLHDRLLPENLAIEGTLAETVIRSSKVPVLLVRNPADSAYRTVVVGIDLSPRSDAAIAAALLVAPDAVLHLVHAYEGSDEAAAARSVETFVAAERQVFARAANQVGLPEIATRIAARPGDPRDVLKNYVTAEAADLLVMSTHGRSGLSRSLLGSVSTDLINERLCDVLVLRTE
ncbi:MAG TPA: universal stress protein [Hyphomicrobiales bacterium]|jgi:nucleotide-binding universal stress UspA family protein